MNIASVRQPTGCLKAAFRRVRHQKTWQRCLATAAMANSPAVKNAFSSRQRSNIIKTSKFEVWPQITSIRSTHPDPMPTLRQQQISELDTTGARTRLFSRDQADCAKPGDVLMATTKSGEPFAGAFIEIRRRGVDTAILLRGQLMRVGVERWFKIYSPTVTGLDVIWRRPKRARRARLTYMRQPKHDMGNVDNLVTAWKKERYALRSRAKPKQGSSRAKKLL